MNFKLPVCIGMIFVLLVAGKPLLLAQRLSKEEVNRIAQSLNDQQLLTSKGKAELIRFSEMAPLQVYTGFRESFLNKVRCSVYFLKSYEDILPGRGTYPVSHFNSLLSKEKDFEKTCAIKEERHLAANFPNRSDLFNFIYVAACFSRDEGAHKDSTGILARRFKDYFGPAFEPFYLDSTIEFRVSSFEDTKALADQRVNQVKPYLRWVPMFKKAGLLLADDIRMETKFSNGEKIISSINHDEIMDDIRKLIIYHDKFPYYKQEQVALMDSLVSSGFIDKSVRIQLAENYKKDSLFHINDLALQTKNYLSLDYETVLKPVDYTTREQYGLIPMDKIKRLYESVLQKAAVLLNFNYSDLEIHEIKNEVTPQYYPSNRQFYLYVKINNVLYKEMIKERDLESWIIPQNFQFLNHYLENQQDERRLYFTTHSLFTTYESQEPETIVMTLLKEQEAEFVRNVYMASKLTICYNGSPGDYSYNTWEPYDLKVRFTYAQVTEAIDLLWREQVLKNTSQNERTRLIATAREKNPVSVSSMLIELPNAFNSDVSRTVEGFLYEVNLKIQELQGDQKDYLKDYAHSYQKDAASDQEILVFSFSCNQQKNEIKVENDAQVWKDNLLINSINKALLEAKIPYAVYPLSDASSEYRQGLHGKNYIMLYPAQAAAIVGKYGDIFRDETTERE
ncbi:hypothetical protein [Pedobacter caeni]|uniref:Uncharacterized protein n=1 Tax=Pedobacter caeni TaxID=288992 RepID=A0A1M4UPC3_9SPHI|nr:hypothetical protein [Pedobacter caeni]SHE58549.1 hypothetical protein SAMN04488522_101637 [Pedobacter caeni]